MSYFERALKDGHAHLSGEGKGEKITYVAVNHTERFSDPEEKVRAEFWAELIYRYGYEPIHIGVEVTVPDRTPKDAADLVVFRDDERKRPYAVVECKQDGIKDAEFSQAVEQACGNGTWAKFRASYVGVVAGHTRRFLDFSEKYGVLERDKNIVADLPKQYGKPEEFRFRKGDKKDDIQPVTKEVLQKTIEKCHQTLWGGGKLSPPTAFGELCKLIFVKISDEQSCKKGEPYQFQIKTNEPAQRLADRVKAIYKVQQKKDPEVFTDTINVDNGILKTVVSHMEAINFSKTDLDTKGVAFERFMDSFFKGDFGQYFTPREIISFAVEMMQPQHDELVLDPACGSGGFLLHALDQVRREAAEFHDDEKDLYRHWHDFAKSRLFGIEINDEIARVAKMNMIIHDDGHSNIVGEDALAPLNQIRRRTDNSHFKEDCFDLVLTNPPFGAVVRLTEKPYLSSYELGRYTTVSGKEKPRDNQKTEILYVERVWQFLRPDGRAAIVLPDGVLTNSSLQYVRDFLLEHFQLLAVVSLPQTAFSHFGAGVKASIVFLRKRQEQEKANPDEAIFMAAPEKIGYDATGRKCDNQLPGVASRFHSHANSSISIDVDDHTVSAAAKHFGFTINLRQIHGPMNPERYLALSLESKVVGTTISSVADILDRKISTKREAANARWDLIRIDDLPPDPVKVEILRTASGKEFPGTFFEVKEKDILIARLGPTILNSKIVMCPPLRRRTVASAEFLVLRCKAEWNPVVVLWFLRTSFYRDLIYSKCRGATPSRYRVNATDLGELPFPQLTADQQAKLAMEAENRLAQTLRLRAEAEETWEGAKAWFQAQLLGKDQSAMSKKKA